MQSLPKISSPTNHGLVLATVEIQQTYWKR